MRKATNRSEMQDTLKARREQQEHQNVPHGCISGWVYVGHLVVEDDGEEVEVVEAMRCNRCLINEHHERF
jgi:hypothetical protein